MSLMGWRPSSLAPCVPATCRQKHCLTQKHSHRPPFAGEAHSQCVGGGDAPHAGRGELDLPTCPTQRGWRLLPDPRGRASVPGLGLQQDRLRHVSSWVDTRTTGRWCPVDPSPPGNSWASASLELAKQVECFLLRAWISTVYLLRGTGRRPRSMDSR